MALDPQLAESMLVWQGKTEFSKPEDWVRASSAAAGECPYCYTTLYKVITEAATRAKLDGVTWHTLRRHCAYRKLRLVLQGLPGPCNNVTCQSS
jgi:hypothetical protein